MKRFCFFLFAAIFSLSVGARAAQDFSAAFDAANKFYDQGKFSEAAAAYEKLAQSGAVSAALYFNLGNACYKSGASGRALAAYRQAENLAPRDPDLRANLQFVRNQVSGPTLPPHRWQRWFNRLTLNEWTALAALAFWLWLLLLIVLQWRPAWRPSLRGFVFSSGLATLALGVCLATDFLSLRASRPAVVVAHDAVVRSGPLEESPTAFKLQDGAEVSVLDEKDQWLQVTAGGQRVGWIRRDQAQLLPPS